MPYTSLSSLPANKPPVGLSSVPAGKPPVGLLAPRRASRRFADFTRRTVRRMHETANGKRRTPYVRGEWLTA
ncbi:MAG: hypothetical protein M3Q08_17050 [Pseudomonadota bacterium]|nr:hypothetical protein [Pseudomonadota bacterium]